MKQCCICLESKKCKKCTKCKNADYCTNCILDLQEKGLDLKCSVCRQEKWKPNLKKQSIFSSKVSPITVFEETPQEKMCCKKITCTNTCTYESIKITLHIFKIITLAFGIGLITLYLINSSDDFVLKYLWLGIIIGLLEMLIVFIFVSCLINKCYGTKKENQPKNVFIYNHISNYI